MNSIFLLLEVVLPLTITIPPNQEIYPQYIILNAYSLIIKRYYRLNKLRLESYVRRGLHQGGSPQNGLGDVQTCGMTLASAYMLRHLSAIWSQLQIKERKSEWE